MRKFAWHLSVAISASFSFLLSPAFCDQVFLTPPSLVNPALDDLNQRIQDNPSAANFHDRAEALKKMGLRKEAVDDLNQSLLLEPTNFKTTLLKGQIYFEDGMYPEAISNINAAIKIDPKFGVSYAMRARAYIRLQDYSKALEDANTMLQYLPNAPVGLTLRAAAYNGLGKYTEAIQDCTDALKINSNLDRAYYWRAEAYQNSEEYEKSIADYLDAIKLQSNYRPAYIGLARSYYKLGKISDALKYCNEAITFHDIGDLKAINKFEGVKASDAEIPADPEYNLGMQITEDLKICLGIYNDILKDKPGDSEALRYRGIAYMHLAKYREAINDFDAANKDLPINPTGFSGIGSQEAYDSATIDYKKGNEDLSRGNYQFAALNYQNALKKYPQYGRCWHNLAIASEMLGDYYTAELCCIHAISYRPDDWTLWQTLGDSLFREFKTDKSDEKKLSAAANALHQSLILNPDSESDKNDIRHLLSDVKNYERALTPVVHFQFTTMPIN